MHSQHGGGIQLTRERDEMARVDISTSSKLSPESAWKLASDLSRFGDWMTIFGGWRGEVPDEIQKGTRVSSDRKSVV